MPTSLSRRPQLASHESRCIQLQPHTWSTAYSQQKNTQPKGEAHSSTNLIAPRHLKERHGEYMMYPTQHTQEKFSQLAKRGGVARPITESSLRQGCGYGLNHGFEARYLYTYTHQVPRLIKSFEPANNPAYMHQPA